MQKLAVIALSLLASASAFSAETLVYQCTTNQGGLDTATTAQLQIFETKSRNEYDVEVSLYRLDFQYERIGMGGEEKTKKSWDGLFCRLYGDISFDCQQTRGPHPVLISLRGGALNAIKRQPVLDTDGATVSEGTALIFNKHLSSCRRI